jgi:hypothetical protein
MGGTVAAVWGLEVPSSNPGAPIEKTRWKRRVFVCRVHTGRAVERRDCNVLGRVSVEPLLRRTVWRRVRSRAARSAR